MPEKLKLYSLNCTDCGQPLAYSYAPFPQSVQSFTLCRACQYDHLKVAELLKLSHFPSIDDLYEFETKKCPFRRVAVIQFAHNFRISKLKFP